MIALAQTIKQYLKNQGQTIAAPVVKEPQPRRREGLFDRMEHALWSISFRWGVVSPPGLSDSQQPEFQYSRALTAREKACIDADLKGFGL